MAKIRLFTIPNILTLGNSLCGAIAVVTILTTGNYRCAFILTLLAGLFDLLDGAVARGMGISSPLGVELDSLADVISFGLLPSIIMFSLVRASGIEPIWMHYIPLIIVALSTLRLAKFNIDDQQSHEFIGLPTPASALLCASLGLLHSYGIVIGGGWIIAIAIAVALLLISPFRMFSLKFERWGWRENSLRYGFLIASAIIAISLPLYAITLIISLYIIISVVRHLLTRKSPNADLQ